MIGLYETIARAMLDAAQEGVLDMDSPAERRRAVRWGLSIVATYDPDTARAAAPAFEAILPEEVLADRAAAERAIEQLTLEQVTGSVLRMN